MRLQNKIALVTGAARGIGEAIARTFVLEGAVVYLTDINDKLGLDVTNAIGDFAFYKRLDVRKEADWIDVISIIKSSHGKLDILVNNAGITGFEEGFVPHDPENVTLENWHEVHRTNLDGVFLGCKHAIGVMKSNGGGSIVNISSRSGIVGIPMAAAYASSKAAVRNHTKSVALYCAANNYNIRCNSIHPAAILTPMWEQMIGDGPDREAKMKEFVKETPLGRFGTTGEVAKMALYLASDESAYVTGSEFHIDGGILAGSAVTPK